MSEKQDDTQSVLEALIRQAVGVENPYGWFIHTFDIAAGYYLRNQQATE